jgi:hypothetical protein
MTRDKENYARIEAITELLVAEGILSREQANAITDSRDFGELHTKARESRRGNGPPNFASDGGNGNGNGKGPNK